MITKTTTAMILFGLIAVIGFADAYADAPDRVTVDSYPFEITILEGGELTLINLDEVGHKLYHNFGNEALDLFIPAGDELIYILPENMKEGNIPEGYALYDQMNDQWSRIHVKAPQPVYVEPVVVIAEPLEEVTDFGATSSQTIGNTTETVGDSMTGINSVATFDGDTDVKALQKSLADVTANFNSSVEKIAEQEYEIKMISANALNLSHTVDNKKILELEADVKTLTANVTTLTADRDEWKALAENWYGVAMAQLKVMVNILGL